MRVFGISRDSPWTHIAWAQTLELSFPLLSDWNGEAVDAFDVAFEFRGLRDVARRSAFQSESNGKLRSSVCDQAMCVHGESRETAKTFTPASANSVLLSRRSSSSSVQVDDQSNR